VNRPSGVELPSITVAVHEVVAPTETVLEAHDTVVAVVAAATEREVAPELDWKSFVPAKSAMIVVLPSPTVSPEIVTVQELAAQVSEEIETVPAPGDP